MGFFVVLFNIWLLSLFFWGIACAVAAVVLALIYRSHRRRWQKVAAIVCGVVAALCIAVIAALFMLAAANG